jgi:hypothetical protein
MGLAARSSEYWRPSNPDVVRLVESASPGAACWRCGTEYSRDALFCHICGSGREARHSAAKAQPEPAALTSASVPRPPGLSISCLIFFLAGMVCLLGALLIGMVYKTETLADWQAVQTWRIEWLLGGVTTLLAGILLKIKEC